MSNFCVSKPNKTRSWIKHRQFEHMFARLLYSMRIYMCEVFSLSLHIMLRMLDFKIIWYPSMSDFCIQYPKSRPSLVMSCFWLSNSNNGGRWIKYSRIRAYVWASATVFEFIKYFVRWFSAYMFQTDRFERNEFLSRACLRACYTL
jgi:hypothetical protein